MSRDRDGESDPGNACTVDNVCVAQCNGTAPSQSGASLHSNYGSNDRNKPVDVITAVTLWSLGDAPRLHSSPAVTFTYWTRYTMTRDVDRQQKRDTENKSDKESWGQRTYRLIFIHISRVALFLKGW